MLASGSQKRMPFIAYPEGFVRVRRVRLGTRRQLTSHVLLDLHPQLHDLTRPPREHACSAA